MSEAGINIEGIKVLHEVIEMQDSPDTAHVLVIKDGVKEVRIVICFGKITEVHEKNSSS